MNQAKLTLPVALASLVLGATASSFDALYGFTGEGQTWKRTERLKLVDGKLSRRTDAQADQEPPVDLTYIH